MNMVSFWRGKKESRCAHNCCNLVCVCVRMKFNQLAINISVAATPS